MNVFERIAVERPGLRRWLLAAVVVALAAYVGWRAANDPAALVAAGGAAAVGAGVAFAASQADRRIYRADPARALRLGRGAASAGAVVGAVVAVIAAPRASSGVPVLLAGALVGSLAVAVFVYPLPAFRDDDDRADG